MARTRGGRRWRLVRARRDAVPPSVRKLSWRARPARRLPGLPRRRRGADRPGPHRTWRWIAGGVALAAVLAGLAWVVFATSALAVREVRVSGTAIAPPEQVRAAAAVTLGTPLARVDVHAVRQRVRALPAVADAAVHRSWPSTLVIDVTERRAVAAVPAAGAYLLVDAEAVPFQSVPKAPAGLPVVRLATPGPDDPATLAALRVLAALTPELRAKLIAVVAETPVRIHLELTGGRSVVWGDADDSAAKARVATALLGQPGRTIDVSAPDVATTR